MGTIAHGGLREVYKDPHLSPPLSTLTNCCRIGIRIDWLLEIRTLKGS